MAELGYPTNDNSLAERVAAVSANPGDGVLLAEEAGNVVGFVAIHSFEMLHRPGRLGRITALVVSTSARRRGVGHQLLSAAERCTRFLRCPRLSRAAGPLRQKFCNLTNRWSGRVTDKVPSPYHSGRAAQLNR
jgi:GNAT superfamily N-acetyltransferase